MIMKEPNAPTPRPVPDGGGGTAGGERPAGPVTTLRGAGVSVDVGRIARVVIGVCLVALAGTIVALVVAGAQRNDQVNRLHNQGVVVEATVSGCIGLMGGSGSNLAGYDCRATFSVGGHRYDEPFSGNTTPVRGARFRAVTVPGDPALLATVGAVAGEQASWRVYILPGALLVVLVLAVTVVWLVARRRRRAA